MLLFITHFIKIYLYLFFTPRSSFDFPKVPIFSVWKVQQSPLIKGSRCFHIRYMSCRICWKLPTNTMKCFWKSLLYANDHDLSLECLWVGWMTFFGHSSNGFPISRMFSFYTYVYVSNDSSTSYIHYSIGKIVRRGYSERVHDLGSTRLRITWEVCEHPRKRQKTSVAKERV